MSNAISRAARDRMARTGEPYTLARRMVIEERERSSGAVENGAGLVSLDPQPPVTYDGPMRDAETGTPESFFAFTDEHGEFLGRLLGPLNPEPSSGPPYTHVLRGPDPDDPVAMALPHIPYTITRDGE